MPPTDKVIPAVAVLCRWNIVEVATIGRDGCPGVRPPQLSNRRVKTDSFANGWKLNLWRKGDDQALVGIQANSFVDKITIALA